MGRQKEIIERIQAIASARRRNPYQIPVSYLEWFQGERRQVFGFIKFLYENLEEVEMSTRHIYEMGRFVLSPGLVVIGNVGGDPYYHSICLDLRNGSEDDAPVVDLNGPHIILITESFRNFVSGQDLESIRVSPRNRESFWDAWARRGYYYLARFRDYREYIAQFADFLSGPNGGVVLDAGCGAGMLFEAILRRLQPNKVVAADFSTEMLKQAEKRVEDIAWASGQQQQEIRKIFQLSKADLSNPFPWSGKSFDVVVLSFVLYYIFPERREILFQEVRRVLKPKGKVYVGVELPTGGDPPKAFWWDAMCHGVGPGMIAWLTPVWEKISELRREGLSFPVGEGEVSAILRKLEFEVNSQVIATYWGSFELTRAQKR